MKGLGMQKPGLSKGDLFVAIKVKVLKNLSSEEKSLFEKLAKLRK
jgi:DnaJ-class molecular chaperone